MVSLKILKQKSATVSSLVEDVRNQLPDNEIADDLDNNYGELYSMILDVVETLDAVISDIEK
ncbi:hypothetical protein [Clostridium botulinum]|uniref:hypothetical protein n=1 Tax=Clostridium botulinum TaxID=1491 RepID=UPI0019679909|nr:hypothetical protein [Clostridium botulinum]MBN1076988.1 hypothetical protein [Clostridium botulinum]